MGHHRAAKAAVSSRCTSWGAPSLLGQALAAARDEGQSEGSRSRCVVSGRGPRRSRSRSREGVNKSKIFRRVEKLRKEPPEWEPYGSPKAAAAHRHIKSWIDTSRSTSNSKSQRDLLRRPRGESSQVSPLGREEREALWVHDLWEGRDGDIGSAVFVRGLPTDITHQELTSNFSKCGRVVAVKLDTRGRIVTAEVSFSQKGAAAIAVKTYHGVSVQSKRGKEKFTLKVAIVDRSQQPEAVEQIEEDDIPRDMPSRFVTFKSPVSGGPPPQGFIRGTPAGGVVGGLAADAERVSIFDRLS